jgi:hypothetical protein
LCLFFTCGRSSLEYPTWRLNPQYFLLAFASVPVRVTLRQKIKVPLFFFFFNYLRSPLCVYFAFCNASDDRYAHQGEMKLNPIGLYVVKNDGPQRKYAVQPQDIVAQTNFEDKREGPSSFSSTAPFSFFLIISACHEAFISILISTAVSVDLRLEKSPHPCIWNPSLSVCVYL